MVDKGLINIIDIARAESAKVQTGVGIPGTSETAHNYNSYVKAFYGYAIDLGMSLAMLMIIYAGYKYVTSQGNSSATNDAKDLLIGALLGLATLFLVRFILNFVGLDTAGLNIGPET